MAAERWRPKWWLEVKRFLFDDITLSQSSSLIRQCFGVQQQLFKPSYLLITLNDKRTQSIITECIIKQKNETLTSDIHSIRSSILAFCLADLFLLLSSGSSFHSDRNKGKTTEGWRVRMEPTTSEQSASVDELVEGCIQAFGLSFQFFLKSNGL